MEFPARFSAMAVMMALCAGVSASEEKTAEHAQSPPASFDFLTRAEASPKWSHRPEVWNALATDSTARIKPPGEGWTFDGQLVRPFRGRAVEGIAPGLLMVVTPLPLENPETGIPRFAWKEGRRPWTEVASAVHGFGRLSAPELNHSAHTGLFSVGR